MVCTQHTGAHGAALARCTSWCSAAHISCDSHAQTPHLGSIPEQDRAVLTAKTACPNLDVLANAGEGDVAENAPLAAISCPCPLAYGGGLWWRGKGACALRAGPC